MQVHLNLTEMPRLCDSRMFGGLSLKVDFEKSFKFAILQTYKHSCLFSRNFNLLTAVQDNKTTNIIKFNVAFVTNSLDYFVTTECFIQKNTFRNPYMIISHF
jgi:hypothetical protein